MLPCRYLQAKGNVGSPHLMIVERSEQVTTNTSSLRLTLAEKYVCYR